MILAARKTKYINTRTTKVLFIRPLKDLSSIKLSHMLQFRFIINSCFLHFFAAYGKPRVKTTKKLSYQPDPRFSIIISEPVMKRASFDLSFSKNPKTVSFNMSPGSSFLLNRALESYLTSNLPDYSDNCKHIIQSSLPDDKRNIAFNI